jgi:cell division protein FtsZ
MDLQAEEKALMEMAAAVRAEIDHAPAAAPAAEVEAPAPVAAPAPAPVMAAPAPAPMAAQTAAVAEAVARAPMAAPARTAPAVSPFAGLAPRESFIPKAPMEPRMEMRTEQRFEAPLENRYETAPAASAPAAAPAPAKQEPGRIRLFDRYRSLTAKKVDDAPAAPQPQANVQRPAAGLNISMSPSDRPVASHSEDELEIPAFLRRQAN